MRALTHTGRICTWSHVTRSVQLGIKCRRMLPVHTLFAIIYKYSRYNRVKCETKLQKEMYKLEDVLNVPVKL